MISDSFSDIFSYSQSYIPEKSGSWSNEIRIKTFFVDVLFNLTHIIVLLFILLKKLSFFLVILHTLHSCPKSSGPLLVHFSSRGDSINSKVKKFFRSNNIHNLIDVHKDIFTLFLEILWNSNILFFRVDTRMNKSIHINIKIIDLRIGWDRWIWLWFSCIFKHFRITHAHPFEEYWDTHCWAI